MHYGWSPKGELNLREGAYLENVFTFIVTTYIIVWVICNLHKQFVHYVQYNSRCIYIRCLKCFQKTNMLVWRFSKDMAVRHGK